MKLRKQVVVIGGGFGGLAATRALTRAPVQVTLVDRRNHHLFQPLLYQVAMAGLSPAEIAVPIRTVLRKQENAKVLLAEVTSIDLAAREVLLGHGETLPYDFLVIAAGSRTSYFGHEDWAKQAPGLKDIEDAIEIRRRVLLAFEAAERETDPSTHRRLLTFVVIGGGPTGVELAGAIAELASFVLARDFRTINPRDARVVLVEGGDRILSTFAPKLSQSALESLRRMGVEVVTTKRVTGIDARGVSIGPERIEAATVLWAAGVSAAPLVGHLGVKVDHSGRVLVEQDCSIPGYPDVFCIGDAAAFFAPGAAHPLPGVSPVAMQQGRFVGQRITDRIEGRPERQFVYRDKGSMATIGRSRAVAQIGNLKLSGFIAWLAWLLVHIYYLIDFHNRLVVLLDWAWGYIGYARGARLITGRDAASAVPHIDAKVERDAPTDGAPKLERRSA